MSVAAATREAVRNRPALYDALRAGLLNYTAAADSLDVDGEREAIASALRRFAAELDADESAASGGRSVTVRLHSNVESTEVPDSLLAVDGAGISLSGAESPGDDATGIDANEQTALRVTGEVDAGLLSATLDRLRIAEVPVAAAGVTSAAMVVVVPRRAGPTAVQLVESAAEST